ncbi:CRISPR-associated protein Cas4 [Halapricum desulfuricans]|uniref:RecB family nuclease n=1 Tax=Halapricum desulfuricans TaxID=2841257 RepID=A0A897MW40_9EURY|nr:Dna2/Cas4 domain-containing protein [Halapricum desulfuricans]QSG04481.1 RecB family nuclease [Halapricum desulfuricans]
MHAFRDVATAAYCPRKLYYRRRDPDVGESIPDRVRDRRELAFEYDRLVTDDAALRAAPIEVTPTTFRSRIGCHRAGLDAWDELADPPASDVVLEGKDARGIAHKVLETPLAPSLVFTGRPPEQGVWEPQSVRLVAAALALSWERERSVERAFAEYPAYGVIREIELSARRRSQYRAALRTAESIDGPPKRTENREKCQACEYREGCGVKTRSLRTLLG